jgi:octaprenyl-diphosphate synthase
VDESSYLQVIRYKTAKLFEASAELGALISQASDIQRELAAAFGRHIGTAFQLMDDLLDYTADPNEMGKNVGDDLREGKPTLPLIFLMEKGSADQQLLAREAILQGIHSSGALEYTQDAARREVHLALNTIKDFPQNPASDSLRALCEYSLIRQG